MTIEHTNTAAVIGGGVIGGGWAARFLLNGWNVVVVDPDPESPRKINQVIDNAKRCLPKVLEQALPCEGNLKFVDNIEQAVTSVKWVQESIPERIELKQQLFERIINHVDDHCIIASSTSGFTPSELNATLATPRVIVAHPFNPVYLLPLVEIVLQPSVNRTLISSIESILLSIGMQPIVLEKEIPAHIADRLLEAVWRESLWLVKDGIANTETIDNVIRYGFGLRWAQMGLFETYRVAGGEAGMRHFLSQFGPTLELPWTKLTNVPEFNEALIELITEQSDQQSAHYNIRELERIRDDNLVDIINAQKNRDWGVGKVFNQFDLHLKESKPTAKGELYDYSQPFIMLRCSVLPSWIDYNGHMNESRYLQVFSDSTDLLMLHIGMDQDYLKIGSYFTVETHICHIDETTVNSSLHVSIQIIAADGKRLHLLQNMFDSKDNRLLATAEQMLLHVDMQTRRTAVMGDAIWAKLKPIVEAQKHLSVPDVCGRFVGQRK